MSYVAIATGAASVIGGGINAIAGGAQKKAAARAAANMPAVPLTNVADGLKVSTLGAKNRQEAQAALEATQTASLQGGGTRALLGGMGAVTAGSQDVNANIGANLDEQQNNIDQMRARDDVRIQTTKEQRNQAKLAALSGQYNAGANMQQQGFGNMIQGGAMAGNAYANAKSNPTTTTTNDMSYSGTQPLSQAQINQNNSYLNNQFKNGVKIGR